METKTCIKCGRELPTAAFSKNARAKDGLQHYCKECNREYLRSKKAGCRNIRFNVKPKVSFPKSPFKKNLDKREYQMDFSKKRCYIPRDLEDELYEAEQDYKCALQRRNEIRSCLLDYIAGRKADIGNAKKFTAVRIAGGIWHRLDSAKLKEEMPQIFSRYETVTVTEPSLRIYFKQNDIKNLDI